MGSNFSDPQQQQQPSTSSSPSGQPHNQQQQQQHSQRVSDAKQQQPVIDSSDWPKAASAVAAAAQAKLAHDKCTEISDELKRLEKEIDAFVGTRTDKLFLKLDEMLTRCVLKLDEISRGDEKINETRKVLVNFAHQLADRLEFNASTSTVRDIAAEGEQPGAPSQLEGTDSSLPTPPPGSTDLQSNSGNDNS